MKILRNNEALSQIIGEIILLAIAIISVSVIYTQVLSSVPEPQDITEVTITGKIQDGHPTFELQRGEYLRNDTKIYINIAGGYNFSRYSLDQSLFGQYIRYDKRWNIGEQIILPQKDIPTYLGPQVEGTIIDTKTNAIVFWGILLEGSRMPYKGGIWHFNESFWSGISKDVNDSSGNNNNGTAKNNPKIIDWTSQPLLTKDKNGGYFDGTNYIEVETSWSLNMTDTITVEAWMKPNTSNFISCTSALQNNFGYTPYIIHIEDTIYAVVSEDRGDKGILQTVNIPSNGENATLVPNNGEINFGKVPGSELLRPIIILMKEKKIDTPAMVLVAFNNKAKAGTVIELRTYNISTNGSINDTKQNLVFPEECPNTINRPSLQKITDDLCAIAYRTKNEGGKLKTLIVSSKGAITPTNYYYNESTMFEPYLFHIHNNVYGLAYRGVLNKGIIKTFNFDNSTGAITFISSWNYSETPAFEPCVTHVSGNVFAVVYRNDSQYPEGFVKTFKILTNGFFEPTPELHRRIFEEASCFDPCVVYDVDNSYSAVYATQDDSGGNPGGPGMYIGFDIDNETGFITVNNSGMIFDSKRCFTPIILPINEHIFAITYTGPVNPQQSGHPGWLITVAYPGQRGIFKGDSYMISSSTNQIEGRINNVKVYYNDTKLGSNWHHIAMTYDGMFIRLYIDGINKSYLRYPNQNIILSKEDLFLGRNYHGYLDEIAIYEKPLSDDQINYISQNPTRPGLLEYYLLGQNNP